MRIAYRPTFAQFADNYLATHYSGGVQTLRRLAGGPVLVILGVIAIVLASAHIAVIWLRLPIFLVATILILAGLRYTLLPLFNLFLVWLRRDEVLGGEGAIVVIELKRENLLISERGRVARLPLESIRSIQHRTESTWILTDADHLVSLPRQDLISGDHDAFIEALEKALEAEEPED
jgi:hypothetical protein